MAHFIVEGQCSLSGCITPQGNKNEALPILAALVLSKETIIIHNLPNIVDIINMIDLLKSIGVCIEKLDDNSYSFNAKNISSADLNIESAQKLRGSLTLIAPLIIRCQNVYFPRPGGDKIGRRRIDTHILALKALGVNVDINQKGYHFSCEKIRGADILLDEASVTATENTIMASCLAQGSTIIHNAASEPHVQQLCKFLNKLGAKIKGIGSNILTIEGVKELSGATHTISADYLEVGSFISLAAVTNSQITIKNAATKYLRMILSIFEKLGIHVLQQDDDIIVPKNQRLNIQTDYHEAITKIDDAPWPGFPADLISIALVTATQCNGTVLIFEKLFESRLFFVDQLINMGARIVLCDPHRAVVIGPSTLYGEEFRSPDIRAGIALLIASLCANGKSIIHNIVQIDRGYENIDKRLNNLGANIIRVS